MEGGIAFFLLLIIVLVIAGFVIAGSTTGGLLWWRKTDPEGDRAEHGEGGNGHRPVHKRPTTTTQENTGFVGTPHGDEHTR
jgi:hypothetical protein